MKTHKEITVKRYGVSEMICDMCRTKSTRPDDDGWENGDSEWTTTTVTKYENYGDDCIETEFDICPTCFDRIAAFIKEEAKK